MKKPTNLTPSSPEASARVKEIWRNAEETLGNLWARWQDEKEYEDFNDYIKVMKAQLVPDDCEFVKGSKRPFGFTFKLKSNGFTYGIYFSGRYSEWKRVA